MKERVSVSLRDAAQASLGASAEPSSPSGGSAREVPENAKGRSVESPEGCIGDDIARLFRENTRLRGEVFRLRAENAVLRRQAGGDD